MAGSSAISALTWRSPRGVQGLQVVQELVDRLSSAILPAWARKSPGVAQVLPLLYLHGLSSGDFVAALEQFLGSTAGLSAATITRLTAQWQDDAAAFARRSLADSDYVYCWVDGIHLKVRLEQDKVCLLVMIGVRVDGAKELVALTDGFRESSESWADLLRDCKRRGMRAPVLAVGDGALGFSEGAARGFPQTKEQRCWFHAQGNVLAALPKSAHPGAKAALAEIFNAEDADHARKAAKAFADTYGAKWPKAVAKISEHLDVLLAFYDFPAPRSVPPPCGLANFRARLCRTLLACSSTGGGRDGEQLAVRVPGVRQSNAAPGGVRRGGSGDRPAHLRPLRRGSVHGLTAGTSCRRSGRG